MPKSKEFISSQLDELITNMGQLALIDNALGFNENRSLQDLNIEEHDAITQATSHLERIQTVDLDATELSKLADSLVENLAPISPERAAYAAVTDHLLARREPIVERQWEIAKKLGGAKVTVILEADNIVKRRALPYGFKNCSWSDLPPLRAGDTVDLSLYHYAYTDREPRQAPFYNYIGYAIRGGDRTKPVRGANTECYVSLVNENGLPQATLVPTR